MKTILFFSLLSLSPLSFADDLQKATNEVSRFLAKPEVKVACKDDPQGDVENSEVKMMYPCSVWNDKKGLLDGVTDKKKVYKATDGRFLGEDEVKALTPEAKKAAESKELLEKTDIFFSKLTLDGEVSSGVVIRSRDNKTTGEKDYTIKLRPMEPQKLNTAGLNKKLIKCERDVSSVSSDGTIKSQENLIENRDTISCSQTIDGSMEQTEENKKFLSANNIRISQSVPYPAIKSEKRSLKATDLGFAEDYLGVDSDNKPIKLKISLEKWQVPGLTYPEGCFLELSAKAPVPKMNQVGTDLKQKFESKLSVVFDKSIVQGNKTGQALKLMDSK